MGSAALQGFEYLLLMNPVYRLPNIHNWAVRSCKGVELLKVRNSVLSLRNVPLWAVLFTRASICHAKGSRFQVAKRSYICSAVRQGCRFADAQESRFQTVYVQIWPLPSWKGSIC